VVYFKVLYKQLTRGTKENHKNSVKISCLWADCW